MPKASCTIRFLVVIREFGMHREAKVLRQCTKLLAAIRELGMHREGKVAPFPMAS